MFIIKRPFHARGLKMKMSACYTFLITAVFLLFPVFVFAENPVVFAFIGEVTLLLDSDDYLEGKIEFGDSITGGITYDLDAIDINPSPYIGDYIYDQPLSETSVAINGYLFKTDPLNTDIIIRVENDLEDRDRLIFLNDKIILPFPSASNGYMEVNFRDSTATVLANDDLPDWINLQDWDESSDEIFIEFYPNPTKPPVIIFCHLTQVNRKWAPATMKSSSLGITNKINYLALILVPLVGILALRRFGRRE